MTDGLYSTWGHNSDFNEASYHTPKNSPPTSPSRKKVYADSSPNSVNSNTTDESSSDMDFDHDYFSQESIHKSTPIIPPGLGLGFDSPFPVFDNQSQHSNGLGYTKLFPVNNSLTDFKGTILFTSHDHEFVQTIATRIVEITPKGIIDRMMPFDEYLSSDKIQSLRDQMYA